VKLTVIDENPPPDGATMVVVETDDGAKLRAFVAPSASVGRSGTVCLLEGRAEYLEKYFETARDLAARGYAVAALDWRGQGRSDRLLRNLRKGHVNSFADYLLDLGAFLEKAVLPNCPPPYYALGHSTGGLVLLLALRRGEKRFERVVLSAPLFGLGTIYEPVSIARTAASVADRLGFARAFVPGAGATPVDWQPFEGNPLTSDPVRFGRNAKVIEADPALSLGGPTIGWVAASLRAMQAVAAPGVPESIETPVLILAAGADRVVSIPMLDRIGRRLKRGRTITIPGALHELFQERDLFREQALAAVEAFLPGR
jgi:lysophospholipase